MSATSTYLNGTLKHLVVPIYNDPSQAGMYGDSIAYLTQIITSFWNEVSYGNLQTPTTASPPILIPGVGGGSNGPYDQRTRDALAAVGFPTDLVANASNPSTFYFPTGFDRFVYITPSDHVNGPGFNMGVWSWINCGAAGMQRFATVHETGHSIGIGHTGALREQTSPFPSIGSTTAINVDETGDFWSIMGYQHYLTHPTSFQKARLGWLLPTLHPVGADVTYTLQVYATSPSAIKIVNGHREIWLEYRAPVGFDAAEGANTGGPVVVHLYDPEILMWNSGYASPRSMWEPVLVYEGYDGKTWSDGTTDIDFQANGKVRVRPHSAPITLPIQPTGVNQVALVQSIQTAASGLVAGAITQAQIDALKTSVNQLVPDGPARTIAFANLGFETPTVQGFVYSPAGASWTFVTAGLTVNNSGFTAGDPNAPQGAQSAFLQRAGSSIKQTAQIDAGAYTLTFKAIQRANWQHGTQVIDVRLDGGSIGTFTPGGSWGTASMPLTIAASGPHELAFFGVGSGGDDFTAFIDDVKIG
jgi:hypothetical protein